MRNTQLLILIITLLIFSCKKDNDLVVSNVGYSYAGMDIGSYIIYDVDSHHYNVPFGIDTSYQFQIKEEIDSKYTDLEGEEAFKVIRYKRINDTAQWSALDAWNAKLTATNYQKTEENVRFIKLIFPVRESKKWDGNSMNNIGSLKYEYTSIHKKMTVGLLSFDSVLTVIQLDDVNLVQEKYFEEKFAAGVGLVYKKSVDINNAFNSAVGLWLRDTGDDVTMTVVDYN